MSTTNLLTQNDNLRRELSKEHVGRSVHQIGNNMQFPAWIGPIYPICCKPTVPTQGVKISVSAMISQISPLKVPLSAKLRLNTAFYFVDQRLTWKKWERFMTGGVTGDEKYNLPFFYNYATGSGSDRYIELEHSQYDKSPHNELQSYFNIGLYSHRLYTEQNDIPNDGMFPEAAPFFAYQMIVRDFYTTVDRLPTNPGSNAGSYENDDDWCYSYLFPPNEDDFRLQDGANRLVNHVNLGKIRYHEVRQDYFSSCFKSPMRGTSPSIDLMDDNNLINAHILGNINSDSVLPIISTGSNNEFYDGQPNAGIQIQNVSGEMRAQDGRSPAITKPMVTRMETYDSEHQVYVPLYSNIGSYLPAGTPVDIAANISYAYGPHISITAAQLTWLNQVTTWKELNILAKPYYRDFLNAHFENVNIGDEQTERPIYIGGTSQPIDISEVTQTSYSSDSPLGNKGATVHSLDSNYVGSFFCNNHGWLIGVAYIIPDFFYEPALPRYFTRRENLDFYSPEFANLSMQAILNKELFVSDDDDWNNQVLGYTGRFDEFRSYPNYVCGDLLNSRYQDLKAWVLARRFDNSHKPAITSKYLNLRGNVDYSAFALGANMPPFMAQFATDIKASMPMPVVAVPKHE